MPLRTFTEPLTFTIYSRLRYVQVLPCASSTIW